MTRLLLAVVAALQPVPACSIEELVIHAERGHKISPKLYGIFFEDINFAADGGLYAELVWNRDFEVLGRGLLPHSVASGRREEEVAPAYADMRPWVASREQGLAVSLTNATQPFAANPTVLRIQASEAGGGVSNPGYWGIGVRQGASYDLSLFAESAAHGSKLEVRLLGREGRELAKAVLEVQGEWQKYTSRLEANGDDSGALLEVRCAAECDVHLDHVSLLPADAVRGLFRRDLFELLKGIKPAFVRFPGGNYLEGYDLATRWAWKKTVGPRQERPGHYNSAWGYWVTDGMGLHEYLVLCEELGAEPLLSVFTGYSMGKPYIPLNESGAFVQDAVDAIEYANGATGSKYGKLRADAGHPGSFGLRMFEVGNEERNMKDYRPHYELITKAIWQAEPQATVIASGRWGPSIEGSPCLEGARCDLWDDHYYRQPDVLANMSHVYDDYNRSLPPVFVGEYAGHDLAHRDNKLTLRNGLAEALFMIGFENNADVVQMASFAPLFGHIGGEQWFYNLIRYNSSQAYGIPGYYVQQLFAENRGARTLRASGGAGLLKDSACSVAEDGTLVLKLVSYGGPGGRLRVRLESSWQARSEATVLSYAGDADAANDLGSPTAIVPARRSLKATDPGTFELEVAPWSLTVLSIPPPNATTIFL